MYTIEKAAKLTVSEVKKLPGDIRKAHEFAMKATGNGTSKAAYNKSETIKKAIDGYLLKLTEFMKMNSGSGNTKKTVAAGKKKKATVKKAGGKSKPGSKSKKTGAAVEYVENIDIEIRFINRYKNMHGKVKTRAQLANLLRSLQKAITKKQIRAKSRFAKEIDNIQSELIRLLNKMENENLDQVEVEISGIDKYKAIAASEKRLLSVAYMLRFIALSQKTDVVEKAERLGNQISKAIDTGKIKKSDRYFDDLVKINQKLKAYVNNSGTLEVTRAQLNGLSQKVSREIGSLEGLNGLNGAGSYATGFLSSMASRYIYDRYVKPKAGTQGQNNTAGNNTKAGETKAKIVNSMVLKDMTFDTIRLAPEFDKMIGELTPGASIMIYGGPGSGKSTLAVLFAKSLAGYNGKRVLIITDEEGITLTSRDKFDRSDAFHKNIDVTDDIPQDSILNEYDVVVFDSVQSLRITPDDMENFNEKHPRVIKLYILQVTKEGKFKGEEAFEHNVDVVLHAENGLVSSLGKKNRFGGRGEIKVY